MELKATLDLEEEQRKRAEAETIELKKQIFAQISNPIAQEIEKYKISFEMRNLNVKFGQKAFNKGYELGEERVANKFLKLDLDFLYEGTSEEAADPSTSITSLLPTELVLPYL